DFSGDRPASPARLRFSPPSSFQFSSDLEELVGGDGGDDSDFGVTAAVAIGTGGDSGGGDGCSR
ncbi:hypothetical protein LINPERHAP1_LOCUS21248, partial [Linum perenne]